MEATSNAARRDAGAAQRRKSFCDGPLEIAGIASSGEQPVEPDVAVLRSQLDEAVRLYHDDRYEATALLLPEMIATAHATVAYYDHGDEHLEALRLRSDV